jgi:NADPH-dependent 2,4-dienoyl-CoA reductase/sulfur reductase-like enzyme/NAD-dependent dihydropyrimidine dehydrogenase PreA subunit
MDGHRIKNHPILSSEKKIKTINFTFNGKKLTAKPGEMISSSLFAHGIYIFGHHEKDNAPQGIFCANGQCSQCLVIADGIPVKSCITPVNEGTVVRSLDGLPELLKDDKVVKTGKKLRTIKTQVLIVGGGPAGLTAAIELGKLGVKCIVSDDKQKLGGKLSLQTHNFFGSIKDCYAGSRGMDIGDNLASKLKDYKSIQIWINSPVVGIFSDKLVGILKNGEYVLVKPDRILITTGAREKTLEFPGCDLPGVYGAGAFQTIVNRDLIKPTEKLFIVGGGNVGLIVAYHALQAGIDVIGIVEALTQVSGYKVHLDKIKRLGIPVFTSHTIIRAEGKEHLERIFISEIDDKSRPIPGTETVIEADTLLIAVGLKPINELKKQAKEFDIKTYAAGDADVISEASAALFSGRMIARKILIDMGFDIEIPLKWKKTLKILRSEPGPVKDFHSFPKDKDLYPIIRCAQEIPCNPCTETCDLQSIKIKEPTMMGIPKFEGECFGCARCVSICPGLAITIVDKRYDKTKKTARVIIPWEMPNGTITIGQTVKTTGMEGELVGTGKVSGMRKSKWQKKLILVSLIVSFKEADLVAGIQIKEPITQKKISKVEEITDDEIIICRCERVTKKDLQDYIKKTGIRDVNAIKAALRVGMGSCGGKTCKDSIMRIFRELGIDIKDVTPFVERPFDQEVPLISFLKEKRDNK